MPSGDLYNARIQYAALGEAMENRFFILQLSGTGTATNLSTALSTIYLPSMKAVQTTLTTYVQNVIVNKDNTTDFGTFGTTGAGVRTGEQLPPFTCWGYTQFSADTRVRSGGKRVGGLSEDDVVAGVAEAGMLTALNNLAVVFLDDFTADGGVNTYQQVMWTPGNEATGGSPLEVPLRSVSYKRVTTQSSRKFPA